MDGSSEGWRISDAGYGAGDDGERIRGHLIEINAILDGDGGLSFDIGYCGAAYDAGSIEMLARLFEEALRAVTQHCLKAPLSHCYTPSDFPLVTRKSPSLLDQSLLDLSLIHI